MKQVWFRALQLGVVATFMSANADAVTRTTSATAISTYQDFSCFSKSVGDISLTSSLSCRNKLVYTWLPVHVDPGSSSFSAAVFNWKEAGSGCFENYTAIAAYTLDDEGQVVAWSGWQPSDGGSGWRWLNSGNVGTATGSRAPGTAGVAFATDAPSGCVVRYATVKFLW